MYKASIIVTLSNEYALTENFFSNLFNIINQDMDIFCVVDGETDRHTIQYLHELEKMHYNISIIYNNENIGYSKANNIGAFLSSSPYLIFLIPIHFQLMTHCIKWLVIWMLHQKWELHKV